MTAASSDGTASMCPPISAKHAKYIQAHLKELRAQCNGFNHCLNELYSQENTLLILQGKDIELTHICSLVQPHSDDEVSFSCSDAERSMIRQDLATHLSELLSDEEDNHVGDDHNHAQQIGQEAVSEGGQSRRRRDEGHGHVENNQSQSRAKLDPADHHKKEWAQLRKCIDDKHPDEPSVDAVCMLQNYNRTIHVCGSKAMHHTVESFFNKQLQHLQCTCDSLPAARSPLYLIIGGAVGGFVLISLIIILLCLVVRQKKKNKKKKKHGDDKWQVSYAAGDAEDASAYSEISDVTLPLSKYRAEALKQKQREGSPGPSLPDRYIKVPPPGTVKDLTGSIEYLEPWDSPRFSLAEVDYDDRHQVGGDVDVHADAADRGSYFIPLGSKPDTGEDCGYETLTKNKKAKTKMSKKEEHSQEIDPENVPDYFILEENK
ncbi:uncharacterized protein [Haliotis cracherodii]|uniref:uncharacterized protein isoform X1 n=1 Tax=Haliotis cracherodii TaxID=6455 RepID=UPI0039EAAEC2